jgi:glycosyltransferase involved in cell wall biosynthesis
MHPIFFLASDLGPGGAARQLGLLAASLPLDRFEVEVGVLGRADTPAANALRAAGVPVRAVPVRNTFDVSALRIARRAVAALDPAVIHSWGPAAARIAPLVAPGKRKPRQVASAAAAVGGGFLGWLTRLRLRRADRVIALTWAEGERYRRLGVPGEQLTRITPGVALPEPAPDRATFLQELGLPATARLVVTAGRLDLVSGLKAAIWAFDIVRHEHPDLYLLAFGEGPDRTGLEGFGRSVAFDDYRVRFPGCRADLPAVLEHADVVWVTSPTGGLNLALEAMAAGRPVVGWRTPEMAEVVADGETGCLVGPDDRAELAAQTHRMLRDPAWAAKLGQAGWVRATEHFSLGRMVERYAALYAELATPGE